MRSPLVVLIALVAAGCAAPAAEPDSPDAPVPARTLDAPPSLVPGEYWRYRVVDELANIEYEVTRVVAQQDGETILIGMPEAAFDPRVLLVPVLGFGEIRATDLAWQFRDEWFEPLRFPLTNGATWTTRLQGNELNVNVTMPEPGIAHVELHGPASDVVLRYDARVGGVTHFDNDNWVKADLIEHGFGYAGRVIVPTGMKQAFYEGRAFGVLSLAGGAGPPTSSAIVDEGFDVASFYLYAGPVSITTVPPAPGAFRERATAPTGEVYETMTLPGATPQVVFFEHESPEGAWSFEHVAPGPGAAVAFGVAYVRSVVDLA